MSADELRYIEEKFSGLISLMNARFENVDDKLDEINKHVQVTNGRVTELEKKEREYAHIVDTRHINCPNLSLMKVCSNKIDSIETRMQDLNFFLRHPKLFIAGMTVIILLTLATFLNDNPLKVFQKELPKTEINVKE
jgi:hypothetical protein